MSQQMSGTPVPQKGWRFLLKRYGLFLFLMVVNGVVALVLPEKGLEAFQLTGENLVDMLKVVPPIFVLLGLLDVWVKRETMVKLMGKGSGMRGILIAFGMGAVAAGPLYAAFPVATVLLKKGAGLFHVLVFLGAWSTAKIPLLLFEASAMGPAFTLLRLGLNIPGILLIAWASYKLLGKEASVPVEADGSAA